ncbi:MAG: hypothetical protein M1825_005907 [Sarcosagium campestre]|nr:MAG: hypothetical protein M1825_005907 [Sarcosagium campestre]
MAASPTDSASFAGGSMATSPSAPSIAMKTETNISPAPMSPPPTIVTRKEWVIPPRPKPGRKPATDTPPTKRKAQNRAAQRAFRERRAARVGELEDQMKEVEEKEQRERQDLKTNITRLESEVESFQKQLTAWQERSRLLERDLQYERNLRQDFEREIQKVASGDASVAGELQSAQPYSAQDFDRSQRDGNAASLDISCGNCTNNSHCECVEQALNLTDPSYAGDLSAAGKRAHSPVVDEADAKRHRTSDSSPPADPTELETDFTSLYSSKTIRDDASPRVSDDPCGFCQDGTPCVCAELERQQALEDNADSENRLAPLLSQFTPPPSDGDVKRSDDVTANGKPEPLHPSIFRSVVASERNPCANGAGTCAQCRADPNSTLFCKSLASVHPGGDSQCCGNLSSGGCCTVPKKPARPQARPYLSCADTFTTLSRHPHYADATDELESWIGKLKTAAPAAANEGRPAMEIEAASVMGVLKFFDRRFGSG